MYAEKPKSRKLSKMKDKIGKCFVVPQALDSKPSSVLTIILTNHSEIHGFMHKFSILRTTNQCPYVNKPGPSRHNIGQNPQYMPLTPRSCMINLAVAKGLWRVCLSPCNLVLMQSTGQPIRTVAVPPRNPASATFRWNPTAGLSSSSQQNVRGLGTKKLWTIKYTEIIVFVGIMYLCVIKFFSITFRSCGAENCQKHRNKWRWGHRRTLWGKGDLCRIHKCLPCGTFCSDCSPNTYHRRSAFGL